MHIKWHKYHYRNCHCFFQTNYIFTRITFVCFARFVFQFNVSEAEKWIWFTINAAIKWNTDGIAMMSLTHTRIAIQSDKICDFTHFVGNLLDIVEDETGACALNVQFNCYIYFSEVLFLHVLQLLLYNTYNDLSMKSCYIRFNRKIIWSHAYRVCIVNVSHHW